MKKELICISCPIGCHLSVTGEGENITVTDNKCPRGEIYGKEEMLAPKRVVTATCAVRSDFIARLPVKTSAPLPKKLINPLLEELYRIEITPPVSRGDCLIENFRDSGVDILATRTLAG